MSATQDNKQGVSQKEVALVIGGTIGGSVVAGLLSVGLFYWHNYNEQKKLREETRRMCQNKFATHKLYILYNMLRLETIKFGLGELQSIYTTFRKRLENPNHGVLTFSDFGALLDEIKGEGKYDRRLALLVFSIWDLDRSGSVDFLELVEGLSVLCHGSQISILSRYFTAFDEDGNGQLNREEVSNLIRAMNPFVTDPKVHQELVSHHLCDSVAFDWIGDESSLEYLATLHVLSSHKSNPAVVFLYTF